MPSRDTGARLQATVTQVSPLHILVDGATTPCPAVQNAEVTDLTVGARVRCEDRAPRRPLVTETFEPRDEEDGA